MYQCLYAERKTLTPAKLSPSCLYVKRNSFSAGIEGVDVPFGVCVDNTCCTYGSHSAVSHLKIDHGNLWASFLI